MKFYFCETCGKRITDRELEEGLARDKQVKGIYCRGCAESVMTLEFDAISLKNLAEVPQASMPASHQPDKDLPKKRISANQSRHENHERPAATSNLALFAGAALVFIVATVALVISRSNDNVKPATAIENAKVAEARKPAPLSPQPASENPAPVSAPSPATTPVPVHSDAAPSNAGSTEPTQPTQPKAPDAPDAQQPNPTTVAVKPDAANEENAPGKPENKPLAAQPDTPADDQDTPHHPVATTPAEGAQRANPDQPAPLAPVDKPQHAAPVQPPAANSKWTDLLPLIDPSKHALAGTWKMDNGALTFNESVNARLEIPFEPPKEYDLEIVLARAEGTGAAHVIFPLSGRQSVFIFGSHCGFGEGEGRSIEEGNAGRKLAPKNNQKYTVLLKIRKKDIEFLVDGKPQGRRSSSIVEALPSEWSLKSPTHLGLGGYGKKGDQSAPSARFIFYSIRVAPADK